MSLVLDGTNGLSDVDGSAATPAIRGTDTNTGIFFPAADTIAFAEGGVESARLDANGNLGLGVTPSAWRTGFSTRAIQVGPVGSLSSLQASTTNNQTYLTSNAFLGTTDWIYQFSDAATQYRQFAGQHNWFIAPSGTAGNAISFTQAMTLDASGNLVLGNTSALGKLDVGLSGTSRRLLVTFDDSLVTVKSANNAANPEVLRFVGEDVRFSTGGTGSGTERARIDSSGNLLVGTTSNPVSDKAVIAGNLGIATGNQINFTPSAGTIEFVNRASGGARTFSWFYQSGGAGSPATLSTSGVWTNASDVRGKENITDIGYGLSTVSALKPRQYDVKSDGSHRVGFVAQELIEHIPEVVHVSMTDKEGSDWYGVDYGSITAVLVKAIQEQQALINAQQAALQTLTARVTALDARLISLEGTQP
jgi:hypothetical protein